MATPRPASAIATPRPMPLAPPVTSATVTSPPRPSDPLWHHTSRRMSPLRAIREATAADAAVIARIVNLAYEVERAFIDGDRTSEAEVRRHLGHGRFLILEEDREPVGCVYVETQGGRGYLGMLSVLPDRQGGGRGRMLVDAVERDCRAAGCSAVDLW